MVVEKHAERRDALRSDTEALRADAHARLQGRHRTGGSSQWYDATRGGWVWDGHVVERLAEQLEHGGQGIEGDGAGKVGLGVDLCAGDAEVEEGGGEGEGDADEDGEESGVGARG